MEDGLVLKAGRHFNLGTSTETVQWANGNSSRMFPFADDSDLGGIPPSFLSDACVAVPGSGEFRAVVLSAHCSGHMVSVSIGVVGEHDGSVAGSCACTVLAGSFEAYRPYALEPVGGIPVLGSVSFGNVMGLDAVYGTWKPADCRLSSSVVMRIPVGRLTRFVDDVNGESVSGDVPFHVQSDIGVSVTHDWNGPGRDLAVFSLDGSLDDAISSPCDGNSGFFNGNIPMLKSINGIRPDKFGRIAIILE